MEAVRFAPYQFGLINLSKTQLKVLRSINPGEEVTSEQIAERCELSSSWASTLLKTVWEMGVFSKRRCGKKMWRNGVHLSFFRYVIC